MNLKRSYNSYNSINDNEEKKKINYYNNEFTPSRLSYYYHILGYLRKDELRMIRKIKRKPYTYFNMDLSSFGYKVVKYQQIIKEQYMENFKKLEEINAPLVDEVRKYILNKNLVHINCLKKKLNKKKF
ncbi:hypothetical protein ABK040_012278 [Willaertia magna]